MQKNRKRQHRTPSFKSYYERCKRLNLLEHRRVRIWFRQLELDMLAPEDERDFNEFLKGHERRLLVSKFVTSRPTPEQAISGKHVIGEIPEEGANDPVAISFEPPRPGFLIGSSGTGKTRAAGNLIDSLRADVPVFILDPRGDYEYIARFHPEDTLVIGAERLCFNPFSPDPKVDRGLNLRTVVAALGDTLTMYHRMQTTLVEAVCGVENDGRIPTLGRVFDFLKKHPKRFKNNLSAYDGVLDRLQALDEIFHEAWNVEQGVTIEDLCRFRTVVIRTGNLGRVDIRVMYSTLILARTYLHLLAQQQRPNCPVIVVVIEEAEYLLSRHRESSSYSVLFIVELTHLARAVGMQLLFITQDPTAISSSLLNDSGNLFVFGHREGKAIDYVVRSLALPREVLPQIASLPDRHCYLRPNSGEFRQPFLIKTIDFPVDDTPLTPAELADNQERHKTFLEYPPADDLAEFEEDTSTTRKAAVGNSYPTYSFNFRKFLYSITTVGHQGLTAVYSHADVSPTTGKKLVARAVDEGLASSHQIVLPGRSGRRTTLFLTREGRDLLGEPPPSGVGGPEHTAYQREFAFALKEQGLDVQIEKTVNGKAVDIAHRFPAPDGKVRYNAIEIEISTDGMLNAEKDLEAGFAEVWLIVSLDASVKMLEKIQETFTKEEQERVHVTTAEKFLREYMSVWEERKS